MAVRGHRSRSDLVSGRRGEARRVGHVGRDGSPEEDRVTVAAWRLPGATGGVCGVARRLGGTAWPPRKGQSSVVAAVRAVMVGTGCRLPRLLAGSMRAA